MMSYFERMDLNSWTDSNIGEFDRDLNNFSYFIGEIYEDIHKMWKEIKSLSSSDWHDVSKFYPVLRDTINFYNNKKDELFTVQKNLINLYNCLEDRNNLNSKFINIAYDKIFDESYLLSVAKEYTKVDYELNAHFKDNQKLINARSTDYVSDELSDFLYDMQLILDRLLVSIKKAENTIDSGIVNLHKRG